jgi:hypothetical protein
LAVTVCFLQHAKLADAQRSGDGKTLCFSVYASYFNAAHSLVWLMPDHYQTHASFSQRAHKLADTRDISGSRLDCSRINSAKKISTRASRRLHFAPERAQLVATRQPARPKRCNICLSRPAAAAEFASSAVTLALRAV